jgi:hypothetical protein
MTIEHISGEIDRSSRIHLAIPIGAQDIRRMRDLFRIVTTQQSSGADFATTFFINHIADTEQSDIGIRRDTFSDIPYNSHVLMSQFNPRTPDDVPMNIGYIRRTMLESIPRTDDNLRVLMLDADTLDLSEGFIGEMNLSLEEHGKDWVVCPELLWGSKVELNEQVKNVIDYYGFLLNSLTKGAMKSFASEGACGMWMSTYDDAGGFSQNRRTSEMGELQRRANINSVYVPKATAVTDSRRQLAAMAMGLPPSWSWLRSSQGNAKKMVIPFDLNDDTVRCAVNEQTHHDQAAHHLAILGNLEEMITRMETTIVLADNDNGLSIPDAFRLIQLGRKMHKLPPSSLPDII